MHPMTIAIPLSILMSIAAAAQEQRKSSTSPAPLPPTTAPGQTGQPQAPVGHRQPTQGGLPPAVRQEEKNEATGRREPDPLGPIPSICKNC